MENERGLWFLRPVMQWEDEERASWGLEEMRAEFKKRLYKETNMITLKPANSGGYRACTENGSDLGGVFKLDDGYYVWWPTGNGAWAEYALREMADILNTLNRHYDTIVRRDLCGPSTEVVGRDYVPPTDLSQEPF